jgi:hypothetical protein
MPKLRVSASFVQLDRERFLRDFRKAIDQAFIKAARKFLLAAFSRIPILTGMASHSFRNLEDIAGRVEGRKSGGPYRIRGTLKGSRKVKPYTRKKYYYYPPDGSRVERTPTAGISYATSRDQILSRTDVGSRMVFKFQVDIKYMDVNEPKWKAFSAGKEAFDAELQIQLKRLPEIGKYLLRRELK